MEEEKGNFRRRTIDGGVGGVNAPDTLKLAPFDRVGGEEELPHVVIIGGGFGGCYAAKTLRGAPVEITLVDKRNFHLFQPLLYQVATGGLSPGDIASPLRAILDGRRNVRVVQGEVTDIDPAQRRVVLRDGELNYDYLIVATGSRHHYFGHDEWEERAPGLKSVEDALEIRRRILLSFEAAERERDPRRRRVLMTFLIVGGGSTGVELAGAVGQLARCTLKNDFRNIDPTESEILLVEGMDRILPDYPPDLSQEAQRKLERLGVRVWTNSLVTRIRDSRATIKAGDEEREVEAGTILWAAGVKASFLGRVLASRTGAELDRVGRVKVEPDLSVPGHPNVFVVGDLAHYPREDGTPLPGLASVAV